MVSERETAKIEKYESEEIPVHKKAIRDGLELELVFNVQRRNWYYVHKHSDKETRKRQRKQYLEIRFDNSFLDRHGMSRGFKKLNIVSKVWLEDDYRTTSTGDAGRLNAFIMDQINLNYHHLNEKLRNKYTPKDIYKMMMED